MFQIGYCLIQRCSQKYKIRIFLFVLESMIFFDFKDLMTRTNNPNIRQVPCGSISGYGTARDLAKLVGILANGGTYEGRTYLSAETVRQLTEALTERDDEVLPVSFMVYGRGTTPFRSPAVSVTCTNPVSNG